MDTKTIRQIEHDLQELEIETERQLREKDRIAILIERSAESCEQETLAAQRDLAVQNLGRNSQRLREIRVALDRIQRGEFGHCAECDAAISEPRLRAVPWARHCRECQERMERSNPGSSFRALRFAA